MVDAKLTVVEIENPLGLNLILGQTHFIKTVEDVYEALITSVPVAKFGVAFCEASGDCLIRWDGTDAELITLAQKNMAMIKAGHTFIIFLKDCFPVNVLNRIKEVSEVCHIIAATANPLQVVIAETSQGRGIMGVIDGTASDKIENDEKINERKQFLRKIGYKR
jgi:adenosine/AMP kinase